MSPNPNSNKGNNLENALNFSGGVNYLIDKQAQLMQHQISDTEKQRKINFT